MTMVAHTITTGFDTTSFSGENGHNQWFDNTILCFHSKNKAFIDKRHPKSKSKSNKKKKVSMLLDDGVTGSLSSSSDPIDIPSPPVVENHYR
jgi:hypothetical protein